VTPRACVGNGKRDLGAARRVGAETLPNRDGLSFGMSFERGEKSIPFKFPVNSGCVEMLRNRGKTSQRTVQTESGGRFRSWKDRRLARQPLGGLSRFNKQSGADFFSLRTSGTAGGGHLSNLQAGLRRKLGISGFM
jgi:hypothetical protein